jgi:purine nucleosidase
MEKTKIIIDTDIGDDIDDALAIAFALESPELEVIGITTVFKNVIARAKLTVSMLKMAGKEEIPVYAGIGSPIINKVNLNEIPCQYSEEVDGKEEKFGTNGIDFIIDTVMKSEYDVTLVPIGPLTNIATAILKEPNLKKKVKEIVMMGGCYYNHCNEWNIRCDPEAARVVFESGIPIKAVGLDVTFQCNLTKYHVNRLMNNGKKSAKYLPELIRRWRKGTEKCPMMHDPLAICAIFDDKILEMRQEEIVVETQGEFMRGATYNKSGLWRGNADQSVIKAAKNVDAEAFIKLFMERTCI